MLALQGCLRMTRRSFLDRLLGAAPCSPVAFAFQQIGGMWGSSNHLVAHDSMVLLGAVQVQGDGAELQYTHTLPQSAPNAPVHYRSSSAKALAPLVERFRSTRMLTNARDLSLLTDPIPSVLKCPPPLLLRASRHTALPEPLS